MATHNRSSRLLEDDADPFDSNGLLKDGHRIRVPLQMRDHASTFSTTENVDQRRVMIDGSQHRPGFRTIHETGIGDAADAAAATHHRRLQNDVAEARADYQDRLVNAWKNADADEDDNPVAARERRGANYSNAKVGQSCTIDGARGHLEQRDGKLVCVPDKQRTDSVSSREQIYRIYDAKKSREWVDPYPDPHSDDDDDVDDMVEQTQSRPNRPNRSAPRTDGRSVKQLMQDKERIMQAEYAAYDAKLRTAHTEG